MRSVSDPKIHSFKKYWGTTCACCAVVHRQRVVITMHF